MEKCEACGTELTGEDRVVAGVPEDSGHQHQGADDDPFAGANRPLLWHEEDFPESGYTEVGRGTLNELIHGGMIGRYL